MTEHDDALNADHAEQPLSDDELDAVAGGNLNYSGVAEFKCPRCPKWWPTQEKRNACDDTH
jgi:hypothetical protein